MLRAARARADSWWGVNVAGYLQGSLGLGEAARGLMNALDAAAIPALPVELPHLARIRQRQHFETLDPAAPRFPVTLTCDDHAVTGHGRSVRLLWSGGPSGPADERWAVSEHVSQSCPEGPAPVVTLPVAPPPPAPLVTSALRPLDRFVFLTSFDYEGSLERRNPRGVIEAFRIAFEPGSGSSLMIKSINGHAHPRAREELAEAAGDHPDITSSTATSRRASRPRSLRHATATCPFTGPPALA